MNKQEAIKKLEAAGVDAETIAALTAESDESPAIAALKAKIAEAEGKANGILGDKKKYQARVEELQAKLDELEGKDLNETGKLKLELDRLKARADKAEKDKADLEASYKTERRNSELGKLAQKLRFLDSVPEDTRSLIVSNELKDLEDLGNTVLVEERLKTVQSKYAGLLASDAPSGAGSKAGQPSSAPAGTFTREQIKNMTPAEYAKNREKILAANQEGKIK